MNVKQRATRKALIGQVASLITGTRPADPKARRKLPFPGTPDTYTKRIAGAGFKEMRFPPEHRPVLGKQRRGYQRYL